MTLAENAAVVSSMTDAQEVVFHVCYGKQQVCVYLQSFSCRRVVERTRIILKLAKLSAHVRASSRMFQSKCWLKFVILV